MTLALEQFANKQLRSLRSRRFRNRAELDKRKFSPAVWKKLLSEGGF